MDIMSYNNNHNNDDKKKDKKTLYQFLDKEGFYIILFLCVCIVAVTAIWVSNQDDGQIIGENPSDQLEDLNETTLVDEPSEEDETSETVVIPKSEQEDVAAPEKEEDPAKEEQEVEPEADEETATNIREIRTMLMPVMGQYGLPYADDKLVYHKTLEQWSTHRGVDIQADEGSPVRAALEGEVIEVVNDTVMGITITIDHGDELLTRYSNLSTDAMVKIGDQVSKGQIISGVGRTASVKSEEGPLLHFQVIYDGRTVNPMEYLPANS